MCFSPDGASCASSISGSTASAPACSSPSQCLPTAVDPPVPRRSARGRSSSRLRALRPSYSARAAHGRARGLLHAAAAHALLRAGELPPCRQCALHHHGAGRRRDHGRTGAALARGTRGQREQGVQAASRLASARWRIRTARAARDIVGLLRVVLFFCSGFAFVSLSCRSSLLIGGRAVDFCILFPVQY